MRTESTGHSKSCGWLASVPRQAAAARRAIAAPFLVCALAGAWIGSALAARPTEFHAGEVERATKTESAGLRNHGDQTLRMLIWYPVASTAVERQVAMGDPDSPVFIAGRVAADAPWADADARPLIALSHGFGSVGRQMTWLGAALARAGYVVVAVDHPGTNGRDGITPEGAYAGWERAGDIRAAIDLVLSDTAIAPHVDVHRIGVGGFSMGGWTAVLLAGGTTDFERLDAFCASKERDSICGPQLEFPLDFSVRNETLSLPAMHPIAAREKHEFRDPRIRAAFLIDPAIAEALDDASLRRIRVPMEIVAGTADPIAVPATNGELIAKAVPHAKLILLPRVAHYDFLSECGPAGLKIAPGYCADGVRTARARTHAVTENAAIRFFDATLHR